MVGSDTLYWDNNGQLIATPTKDYYWTEDYWLRNVSFVDNDDNNISVDYRYTPQFGNMVYREKTVTPIVGSPVVERKKIISDITGKYPLVLMEIEMDEYLEPASYQSYYYANNQILAQLQRDTVNSDWYYYLCDRLGSVRTLIDCNSDTVSSYTYDSFGNRFEAETYENPTVENPYQFAGYRWDQDAEMFYCNARWYNPEIYRFTGRDPVRGEYKEPFTLHAYLYCANNPVNCIDPNGRSLVGMLGGIAGSVGLYVTYLGAISGTTKTVIAGGILVAGGLGAILYDFTADPIIPFVDDNAPGTRDLETIKEYREYDGEPIWKQDTETIIERAEYLQEQDRNTR